MEDKYKEGDLKEYQYWTLTVSFRQHTPGSFIILAKRPVELISKLTDDELLELKVVMQEAESLLSSIKELRPDRFNYLQLGNTLHQLHLHGIPRYATPRLFLGQNWVDSTFGKTPVILGKDQESDIELVIKIRDHFKKFLK